MQYFLGMAWAVLGAGRICSEECVNVSGGVVEMFSICSETKWSIRDTVLEYVGQQSLPN